MIKKLALTIIGFPINARHMIVLVPFFRLDLVSIDPWMVMAEPYASSVDTAWKGE